MRRPKKVYGAALDELLVRMIEQQSYGIAHLSRRLMSDHEPGDEQKLTEAITAESALYRAVVRNVLHQVAVLVNRTVDELGPELRAAIDALFQARRVMLHEWLALARGIIVRQQLAVSRLEDRVDALEGEIKELRAAAGLNSIEAGNP
jgi:hypothetical protein